MRESEIQFGVCAVLLVYHPATVMRDIFLRVVAASKEFRDTLADCEMEVLGLAARIENATDMIGFYDFAPRITDVGGFFKLPVAEQLAEPLKRASEWVDEHSVEVMNIETVLLPNIHSPGEEGSGDPILMTSGDFATAWYQIVRVWYRS